MNSIALKLIQNHNITSKEYRRQTFKQVLIASIPYLLLAILLFILLKNNMFAIAGEAAAGKAFGLVIKAVRVIGTVAGALFVLVGIIRFVIAHANEDGPNQQKAALMIATGVALIIVVSLIGQGDLTEMVDFKGENGVE